MKKLDKKIAKAKRKVSAKVARGKAKVVKKCAGAVALGACLASLAAGCQNPAQRAQTAETKQEFNLYEGSHATFTFGSEFVSLAQSNETGGNDAGLVASPTTETKPEIAVGVGGSSAGVGQAAGASSSGTFSKIGAAVDAVASLVPGGGDAAPAAVSAPAADCPDGNCGDGECAGGACSIAPQP